jgi:hypothetical protein
MYLLSDLQTRINLIDEGDINKLRFDNDESLPFHEWDELPGYLGNTEVNELLNMLLDKVDKILLRNGIVINKTVEPYNFMDDSKEAKHV